MKKFFFFFFLISITSCQQSSQNQATMSFSNDTSQKESKFYDFKMKSLDGKEIDFAQYKGKNVLIVNVASKCGYTPQYADLQKLHEQYGNYVTVLGFPANNFGGQEPGTNQEIASFCRKNYGVTFQMFEKISVKGEDMHPLYKWLSNKAENGGMVSDVPTWNFCKYLINKEGKVVKFFPSRVNPLDSEIISIIKQ
ncbi:MAG: glutathione peroxidase [Cytophagales bacterium]|nr:glutathione peroxidase [Cytophagales bacterium]MDW8383521.1 glutathione peroxidase [Flammeovirgaceae bacterium]